jgi:hypothetical protein
LSLILHAKAHKVNGGLILQCVHPTRRRQSGILINQISRDWFVQDDNPHIVEGEAWQATLAG